MTPDESGIFEMSWLDTKLSQRHVWSYLGEQKNYTHRITWRYMAPISDVFSLDVKMEGFKMWEKTDSLF